MSAPCGTPVPTTPPSGWPWRRLRGSPRVGQAKGCTPGPYSRQGLCALSTATPPATDLLVQPQQILRHLQTGAGEGRGPLATSECRRQLSRTEMGGLDTSQAGDAGPGGTLTWTVPWAAFQGPTFLIVIPAMASRWHHCAIASLPLIYSSCSSKGKKLIGPQYPASPCHRRRLLCQQRGTEQS